MFAKKHPKIININEMTAITNDMNNKTPPCFLFSLKTEK